MTCRLRPVQQIISDRPGSFSAQGLINIAINLRLAGFVRGKLCFS